MDEIASFIDHQLELWEVPGCAVGVIRNGEILLSSGFGTKELGADAPVTSKTLFQIGSTSKSFTAAAVASLVDEGIIEWDRPLRDYIPGFAMHDPVATERIGVRDVLSHRSGLPRHEFVWLGQADRTRAELVRRLRYLPLSKDIRQKFQYANLGYVTAGHLIEVVSGQSWDEYILTRLLKPLGMDRSNVSVSETLRDDDHSRAHERRGERIVEIPYRDLAHVAPAGGINSCSDDMLAYLRMQLGADDREVVSREAIAETHRPQIVLPEDRTFPESTRSAYGLGWTVGEYRGHRIVEHGGGIDGFLTECMMLPDDGIGVIVLTNFWSGMGPSVVYRVFDTLLGLDPIDWPVRLKEHRDAAREGAKQSRAEQPRVPDAPLLRPLAEYAGDYEQPGYGTISITVADDGLVPSFGTLQLSMTHRHFDVFDLQWHELADQDVHFDLIFLTGPDGDVVALTVPFEDQLGEPIRFDRLPDARARDPQMLAGLTGRFEMGPIELVVGRKGETALTVATPGNPAVDLVPGRGLRFSAKEGGLTLEFVLDDAGRLEKLVVRPLGVFLPKREP
jgi:CubicO group peptidase (beta-lactamase class C family)